MAEDILGGRLSIEDAFSSPLEKFANQILGAENRYKKFADGIINSNRRIENSMNQTFSNLEKVARKFIENENKAANAINNANNKVKQNQEKTIDQLIQKYGKLGEAIKGAYSAGDKTNISTPKGEGSGGGSGGNSLKDFAQDFLNSGFAGVIGKLGLVGAGITAGITVMKTLNNWMEQGFNVLNKVTDGLFSYEGIKSAIQESMTFQTGRAKLDLFTGSEEKGLEAYQTATYEANKTYAGESDTIDIMSKLEQLGVDPKKEQLEKLLDIAGTRPEVDTAHIGLAVKEAIEGRINMLQMYGVNNKNLKSYYDSLKKTDPTEHKQLNGALNKKGTAGNPQKYFDLLTSYIKQSPVDGYSERYVQTAEGAIKRLDGIWNKLKADMMGIDVANGIERPGSALDAIAKSVNKFKDVLNDETTITALEKVGDAFGSVFTSLGNAFTKALTPETIAKVADAITKIGESLAKMIDKFVSSGQLDKLIDNLPALVDKILGNKVIDVTTDVKTGADVAQNNFGGAVNDKTLGIMAKIANFLGFDNATNIVNQDIPFSDMGDTGMPILQGGYNYDSMYLTDANASTYIDKNSNLSKDQKNELKDVIKGDGLATYNTITIGTIQANNFDEIMKSLEEAKGNRK